MGLLIFMLIPQINFQDPRDPSMIHSVVFSGAKSVMDGHDRINMLHQLLPRHN